LDEDEDEHQEGDHDDTDDDREVRDSPDDFEDDPDAVDISELLNDHQDTNRSAQDNQLLEFVSSLDQQAPGAPSGKRKRVHRQQAEPQDEQEGQRLGESGRSGVVSLDMLLGQDAAASQLGKRLKKLQGDAQAVAEKALAAPLPPVLQKKVERETAYDASAREISKWMPIVTKNRQAEHLSFPLHAPGQQHLSSAALASNMKVKNINEDSCGIII
jgi:U3 small nucleolar RNA-associated protein 14